MGLSEDVERKLLKTHNENIKALNLDKSSASEAWKALLEISDSYILEGEPLHWLGCTTYIACKSSFTPTVSKPNVVVQGNLVSLTRLLRIIDLSLIDFFLKMRKCAALLSLSEDFKEHMEKLEKNFNVSMVLFRKFQPIFSDVFRMENVDVQKPGTKAKKLKTHPPSCWRIMDFTWTLFICVKANVNNITDDLVNSYHLLLACIDLVYANVYVSGRKEMLKANISSTPEKLNFTEISDLPCIIDYLCKTHDGIIVDVKSVKEYCLRKYVKKLFEDKIIRGNDRLLTEVMEFTTFESNMKALGKLYEEYTLSLGGVDERVFLGYSSNMCNIGNFGMYGNGNAQEIREQLEARRKQNALQGRVGPPLTPLSGKRYLKHNDNNSSISENNSFSLHSSLMARDPGPAEITLKIIKNCPKKPILVSTVDGLIATLHTKLLTPQPGAPPIQDKSALKEIRNVSDLSAKLFYKFLDSILPGETKKPTFDPNVMLNNEQLIKALFACAAEVVLYTSKITKKFPWILDTLSIPPYYCYKVIEVIVTYEDLLTRELVKHLNAVEESILESLAWSSTSPLWKALVDSGLPVPSCEDVVQEGAVEYTEVTGNKAGGVDKLAELASKSSVLTNSPGAPLADKFMSPIKGKRPYPDDDTNGPPPLKVIGMSKPDCFIQIESADDGKTDAQKCTKENKKPKRTGSTSLFRKFYYLAVVRMLDMCNQLGLSDIELRRKIWTCFELTIVNHVGLMWNRHLDQLLMCSIYVICKIGDRDPSFVGMMKCYRNQPQCQWQVYRQVLINPDKTLEDIKKDLDDPPQTVEERGDIIRFYNEVFIHKVKELTRKFRNSADDRIVLSPILVGKSTPVNGPRRVSEKHPLYLRALINRSPNSGAQLHYRFSSSPAKDLHAINNMVCKAEYKKPKILKDDSSELKDHSNSISQKVKDIYADRISLKKQDLEKQK
uniref:Retinoblastoma-like protein 1 n=1 Tax=Lygus hesperus TaxID=30085 RepID=A0A0A9YKF7_LYGHE